MRAYYLTSEKWGLEALRQCRLKLSLLDDMNDPFELLGMDLSSKLDRAEFQRLKAELNEEIGSLCFTKWWRSPVMWSHYADKHNGICLGFDVLRDWVYPISYQARRLVDDAEDELSEEDHLGHKLLTTKFEEWKYEREIRMIVRLEDAVYEGGLHFLPFCDALRLKEIILGARSSLAPDDLEPRVGPLETDVRIVKSRLAFKSFRIIQNRAIKPVFGGGT